VNPFEIVGRAGKRLVHVGFGTVEVVADCGLGLADALSGKRPESSSTGAAGRRFSRFAPTVGSLEIYARLAEERQRRVE
jgi:hypothetical protein